MNNLYVRLAAQNIKKHRRSYVPFMLAGVFVAAVSYILNSLSNNTELGPTSQMMFTLGSTVVMLFAVIFLFYTNSFLMKRRTKELGLYNVLGMGKKNIAGIMVFESIYIGLAGIILGLALGILLHKLMTLLLFWLMRLPAPFGFSVQLPAVLSTTVFFAVMIFLTLLLNLWRVGRSKPVELLRGGAVGE